MHSPRTSQSMNFWQQPWLCMRFRHFGMNFPNFLFCVFLSTISQLLQFWKVQISDVDGLEASMVAAKRKKIVNFIFEFVKVIRILYFRTFYEVNMNRIWLILYVLRCAKTTASELYQIAPSSIRRFSVWETAWVREVLTSASQPWRCWTEWSIFLHSVAWYCMSSAEYHWCIWNIIKIYLKWIISNS